MNDVLTDIGKQRIVDGQVQTLAKTSIACWVPTDDVHKAQRELGKVLEAALGEIDWTNDASLIAALEPT